ncbi:cytochrome P450 [Nocardioides sp.]|uniref:cytochrome P450 n=1 Tax=Nocardioides sp. TaxID=35761 RepID=UPI003565CC19
MTTDILPEGFDPTNPDVLWKSVPHEQFAELRMKAPVHWIEQPQSSRDGMAPEAGTGYWAISKHADVSAISKDNKNWSAMENGAIIRFQPGTERDQIELQRVILLNQDPPEHTSMRHIISRGFTPRAIGGLEEIMHSRAQRIVKEAVERGSGDFVEECAAELPLQAIADLIGVPQEDRKKLFHWSNSMLANEDPDFDGDPAAAATELLLYSMAMAAERKENPQDDLVTKLINADKDGRGLTDDEFGYFVMMLSVAGNETTRNAISHGMYAFLKNPDQWKLWVEQRPETMVDEVIRWATPVNVFQRTALNDTEINGVAIKKGQRAGLFYGSANYDEDVFDKPHEFNILRDPNPHLAFGGHGAHYCIGANLARQEVRLIFTALAEHAPNISMLEEPRRLRHGWINGIKDLQVSYAG